MVARIIKVQSSDRGRFITITAGEREGVVVQWKGTLLRGDSDEPLPGGEVVLVRVTPRMTIGTVTVSEDVVRANTRVRLSAP